MVSSKYNLNSKILESENGWKIFVGFLEPN